MQLNSVGFVGIGVTGSSINDHLHLADNYTIGLGGSSDLRILHDSNHSYIKNYTGDLYIENFADDKDIIFKSDNGSGGVADYLRIDGGITSILAYKDILMANDGNDGKIKFGASQDLQIYHNGNNSEITHNNTGDLLFKTYVNDMQFINYADDSDIKFLSDDGSGGVTEYFRLDGGLALSVASKHIRFEDSVEARFGTGGDARIFHDATDTYFDNFTGDLYIKNLFQFIKWQTLNVQIKIFYLDVMMALVV